MKVEKKNSSGCVVDVSVNADAGEIAVEYKKVLNAFVREAAVPGFRKGKTPLAVIKQKFQQEIQQEAQQACFRALYPQVIKEAALEPIDVAGVKDVVFNPETGFAFTVSVEVKPEFDLPKYKKLAIKKNEPKIEDADVDKRVEELRAAFAKFEDPKEGDAIGDGDFVQFDYSGTLGGKPLSEVVPDQKAVCGATAFWVQIEEGRFLPEILDALKGLKAGDEKKGVKVKFPKDNAPDALKGKTAEYDLSVKAFRRRALPDDAEMLKSAKSESMEKLRADFRDSMQKDADRAEQESRRNQAIELMLKKADFDVPPSLVRRQVENYLSDLAQRMQNAGVDASYVEQNREKILADAEDRATKQVRLSYILAGIVDAEKIEATDADVDARLSEMADSAGEKVTKEELRKRLEENGQIQACKEQLQAEKALDLVLAEAK